jgi:hypothetical protein
VPGQGKPNFRKWLRGYFFICVKVIRNLTNSHIAISF